MHVKYHVQVMPVQRRHRARHAVEVTLIEMTTDGLDLGPINPQADDVEPRTLHHGGVGVIERRRRVFRIGDQRVNVEPAQQHLAAIGVDDLAVIGTQPGERATAEAGSRSRDRGAKRSGRQVGDDRQ